MVRWKHVHLKNNLITSWGQYGAGSISHAHLRVEKNIFESGGSALAVHSVNWGGGNSNGLVKKISNLQNGFTIEVNNPDAVFIPPYLATEPAVTADPTLEAKIKCGAGARWGASC